MDRRCGLNILHTRQGETPLQAWESGVQYVFGVARDGTGFAGQPPGLAVGFQAGKRTDGYPIRPGKD